MPEPRDQLFNLMLSKREVIALGRLADAKGISKAALVREWLRDAAREASANENARAWENGTPAEELDAENA